MQTPSFVCSGTMAIEFNDKKKKKKKKNNNMNKMLKISLGQKVEICLVYTQITFLCCQIIKSQINLKLKARSEFPNVSWGEIKIAIPIGYYRTL